MPEGYTHIRTARAAARLANIEPADGAAFDCGANGPDMLFCYRVWRKSARRGEDLPKIGDRLHGENTGAFLQALLENAKTPAQQSYAMGFLCHYAADCALHPYVVMITKPGAVYGMPGGHGYFEIALDSFLHQKDTGKSAVSVNDNTPSLSEEALEGAAELLQAGIRAALGLTACGLECVACPLYSKECPGCNQCNGRVFHAPAGKTCPLYACAVHKNHRTGCGGCPHLPCALWEQVRDPALSDEAFRASVSARLENWKGVPSNAL